MPRAKQWTTEDMERALQWVSNKAKTGAIFRGQSQTAEELVPRLAGISDPAALAAALAEELTPEAWRRLLNALRQRKHAAGGESDSEDEGRQREDAAEAVRQFQSTVARVGDRLRDLLETGGIINLIDEARQRYDFGPGYGWTIRPDGPAVVIERHPQWPFRGGGTHASDTDDGERLTRPGAVRLRVMIEPVTEIRQHTESGTEFIEAAPDTWDNVCARVISAMERQMDNWQKELAHSMARAAGNECIAPQLAAQIEALRGKIEALRATVATWESAGPQA